MITLKEIADAIDEQWDEMEAYYDRETQKIFFLNSMSYIGHESGEIEDLPDWQQDEIKLYRLVMEDDEKSWGDEDYQCTFLKLPDKFDVNEYRLMELFSAEQEDEASAELFNAIRGKGAFRHFRDTIERLGLSDKWYEYKEEHLMELAKEFCEANEIEFKE